MPSRAQEACETWTVEMMEDEGGSVLTAAACTREFPDAWMLLTCYEGSVFVRYDLAWGAEKMPELSEVQDVDFEGATGASSLNMQYQEMDGLFAAEVSAGDAFFDHFRGDGDVRITDRAGIYPEKSMSLAGAGAALDTLLAGC